mmetsp:Transcript_27775/g.58151  ORF Transcript_27775/g.58151 Transcript_27775/m.58151 type:complete len:200 (+) Transcript_27775:871-1470(+)
MFVHLRAKVSQSLVKLFFSRNSLGHIELSSNLVILVIKMYCVAHLPGRNGKGTSSWPGADHANCHPLVFWEQFGLDFGFVTSGWIDQTTGYFTNKDVIQASLIASNAGIDFIFTSFARLLHEIGIGQEWSSHADQITRFGSQQCFSCLGMIDTIGGHEGDGNDARLFEFLCGKGKGCARNSRGNGGNAGFVPSNTRIDN